MLSNILKKLTISSFFITLAACTHSPEIPVSPAVSFATQVQPILVANCTKSGCHGGDGRAFPLMTYDNINSWNLVTPGNAKNSRLYSAITGTGEDLMPPDGSLSNDDIVMIYLWIEQGAKNN